jgi:hypothetical protein
MKGMPMNWRAVHLVAMLSVFSLVACGDKETPDAGTPGADAAPEDCSVGSFAISFSGTVMDEGGAPISGAAVTVCYEGESSSCLTMPQSDNAGAFSRTLPDRACVASVKLAISLVDTNYASSFCGFAVSPDESGRVNLPAVVLHATSPATVPELGDTGVERTVTFASGLELDVTPAWLSDQDDYSQLAGTALAPDAGGLCFLNASSPAFERVYGFSPETDIKKKIGDAGFPGFPVRIPNSTNLPAGSTVDLYVLGGSSCILADRTWVAEAEWAKFGTATVSADGGILTGNPVPCLNWLGYARQP